MVQEYNLEEYLQNYLANAVFPSKYTWKTKVMCKIRTFYEAAWHERLNNDADFARFRFIHPELRMLSIWTLSHDKSSAHAVFLVARLCATISQQNDLIRCFCVVLKLQIYISILCLPVPHLLYGENIF